MKRNWLKWSSLLASLAMVVTTLNANAACWWLCYQPKLPEGAERLRKF